MGHARFEKPTYRTREEVEEWKKLDCIKRLRDRLMQEKEYSEKDIANVEAEVTRVIDEAVEFARNSPDPEPESYKKYIFKGEQGNASI
jgi:TPP-dependent pyruvate/acetoin dehydrogenase alpha subunit